MATIAFTRVSVCAGGDHVTFDVSFNGGPAKRVVFDIDDLSTPIANMTPEEREAFAKTAFRIHIAGKTRAQVSAETASPVTVTI